MAAWFQVYAVSIELPEAHIFATQMNEALRGKKVEHLVLSSPELRVDYWIDSDTALPGRSLVVYVDHPLRPHFMVEYAEWKLNVELPPATFTLSRPTGAAELPFRDAASSFR